MSRGLPLPRPPAIPRSPRARSASCSSISARPEGTSYWPMRRYLKEFLSDRRVIETNRALWWVILNGVILTIRPTRSGHAYAKIWNRERNESPLKTITRAQAEKLAASVSRIRRIIVDWAMRYGLPPIGERIEALKAAGCDRILHLSALSAIQRRHDGDGARQVLRRAEGDALAAGHPQRAALLRRSGLYRGAGRSARRASRNARLEARPDPRLVPWAARRLSRGGRSLSLPLPEDGAAAARGDSSCPRTSSQVVFQSRFGRAEWLKPYAQDTVESAAGAGRQESGDDHAGLFRRLRRDTGRSGDRPAARHSTKMAARISRRCRASMTARFDRHAGQPSSASELSGWV